MKLPKIRWDLWVVAIIIGIVVNVPLDNPWVDRVSLPWLLVISALLGLAFAGIHKGRRRGRDAETSSEQ